MMERLIRLLKWERRFIDMSEIHMETLEKLMRGERLQRWGLPSLQDFLQSVGMIGDQPGDSPVDQLPHI